MPKITVGSLTKLTKLTKLAIPEKSNESIIVKINAILDLSDDLQALNTKGVDLFDGWRKNTIEDLREDIQDQDEASYQKKRQNIITLFPNSQNNLLVIDGIFEES